MGKALPGSSHGDVDILAAGVPSEEASVIDGVADLFGNAATALCLFQQTASLIHDQRDQRFGIQRPILKDSAGTFLQLGRRVARRSWDLEEALYFGCSACRYRS